MIKRFLRYIVLPREISGFEVTYLRRINRIALVFFWLHLPVFPVIAWVGGSSVLRAIGLTLGVLIGPSIAYFAFRDQPRRTGLVFGVTAMLMGGVLVYINTGPLEMEMHFYFFVLIALLSVFANPMVIIAAAVTVATHHLVLFLIAPDSVFNYNATWVSVAVHAVFVVLESVAACFVARSFFDNVIGLEKIVEQRTREMSNILDNVAQGFVTIDFDGLMGPERSRALDSWFGAAAEGSRWWDYVSNNDEERAWLRLGFDGLVEDLMPVEATLDQFPKRVRRGTRELAFEYRPIGDRALLAVVTDVTNEVARRHAERVQQELVAILEKVGSDRNGFAGFMREGSELVGYCSEPGCDQTTVRRYLHTLKGNSALFGVTSVAEVVHELETEFEQQAEPLTMLQQDRLVRVWADLERHIARLGISRAREVIVKREEFDAVVDGLPEPAPTWTQHLKRWGLDPSRPHLERLGEQATMLGARLEKANIDVCIDDGELRVDGTRFQPLWSALVHAIRNAVSHGIETSDERIAAGKSAHATLTLRTMARDSGLEIEVSDDGAGVNWAVVETVATERGLPVASQAELANALFSGRLSTAREVSDVSGRGVGLNALRTACRQLGGDAVIESELGRGTTVRCIVPMIGPPSWMQASA